jgi:hypothetical protein
MRLGSRTRLRIRYGIAKVGLVCWFIHGEKLDAEGAPDYSVTARRSFQGIFLWEGGEARGSYSFDPIETPDRSEG